MSTAGALLQKEPRKKEQEKAKNQKNLHKYKQNYFNSKKAQSVNIMRFYFFSASYQYAFPSLSLLVPLPLLSPQLTTNGINPG